MSLTSAGKGKTLLHETLPGRKRRMDRLDDKNAIEIADNIWWVGFADYEAGFSNNPYLLVAGDEAGVARV